MTRTETRRFTLRAALVLAASVSVAWTWTALSSAAPQSGKPGADALANPLEQRREMIELLRSIDRRLATIEQHLAKSGTTNK